MTNTTIQRNTVQPKTIQYNMNWDIRQTNIKRMRKYTINRRIHNKDKNTYNARTWYYISPYRTIRDNSARYNNRQQDKPTEYSTIRHNTIQYHVPWNTKYFVPLVLGNTNTCTFVFRLSVFSIWNREKAWITFHSVAYFFIIRSEHCKLYTIRCCWWPFTPLMTPHFQ